MTVILYFASFTAILVLFLSTIALAGFLLFRGLRLPAIRLG
jgi:hypothetical protein